MNLGGNRYRKFHLRDEKSRRWVKMRQERTDKPMAPAGTDAGVFRDYLEEDGEASRFAVMCGVALGAGDLP